MDYNLLLDYYKKWYRDKYGSDPVIPGRIDDFPIEVHQALEKDRKRQYDRAVLNFIFQQFGTYIKCWKDKKRYIYCIDSEGHELYLPLDNRFSESYSKRVKTRMIEVQEKHSRANAVMVTLTLNPALFKSKPEMWVSIKPELNRFLTAVRIELKKYGREMPPYIATIEAMHGRKENNYLSKGNPHIHIVFIGASRLMDWRRLTHLWGKGHIWINRTYENRKVRNPISYVTKYITKTFTEVSEENMLQQALVWFFGVRSYSCSRGLIRPLNEGGSLFTALCFVMFPGNENLTDHEYKIQNYVNKYLVRPEPPPN